MLWSESVCPTEVGPLVRVETEAILEHYRDRCRDGETVAIGDKHRTDRGEVDHVGFEADAARDFVKVTIKIPIRRHTDR